MTDVRGRRRERTDRERRMDKLRKCLAMATSRNANEAATALRQAQALMAELGVTRADVEAASIVRAVVRTREGFGACATVDGLTTLLCRALGVRCVYERNPGSADRLNVVYYGPRDRALLAEHAHVVMWRSVTKAWELHRNLCALARPGERAPTGARQAFVLGWLAGVARKVERLVPSEEDERAMGRYCELTWPELGEAREARVLDADPAVMGAGLRAARDFDIHVPLREDRAAVQHEGTKQ